MDLTPDEFRYGHIAMAARKLGFAVLATESPTGHTIQWIDMVDGRVLNNSFVAPTKREAFMLACDFLVDHVAIKPTAGTGAGAGA